MDAISTEQGADWAAVTPLIQKRQRQAAERAAAGLSPADQQVVDELRTRDREVRDHEQAHKRVGGPYASHPTYSYQVGPDGKQYAVGRQVQIDTSPIPDDPAATVAKMEIVKAAALAPSEPSSADRQVAALADAMRTQALGDLAALRRANTAGQVDLKV